MKANIGDNVDMPACPSPKQLQDYLSGAVTDEVGDTIASHVSSCVSCRRALERLANTADLFSDVSSGTADVTQSYEFPRFSQSEVDAEPLPSLPGLTDLRELGRGGMAVVFQARQTVLGRTVAVKMIRDGRLASKELLSRFHTEARAVAQLQHPGIVQIHELGVAQGMPYLIMEYCSRGSLGSLLKQRDNATLAPREAARLLVRLARAIHYAHERRPAIIHRDIKPDNILFAEDGTPKISDFGLAKIVDVGDITATGDILGTATYMAPEQASGRSVSALTDVYALGAVLYRLLCGRPPLVGETMIATLKMVNEVEPPRPRDLQPGIPIDLETICLKCLQKEPCRRYASALELAADLERFLESRPIHARRLGRLGRLGRWCARNPKDAMLFGSLATTLLFALAAAGIGYFSTARALDEARDNASQTLDVVDKLYLQVSQETLLDQPRMAPVRRELLEKALEAYNVLLQNERYGQMASPAVAKALLYKGRIHLTLGDSEVAEQSLRRAAELFDEVFLRNSAEPEAITLRHVAYNSLGDSLYQQRKMGDARLAFTKAEQLRREELREHPKDDEVRRQLANTIMNLAVLANEEQQWTAAERLFAEAGRIRADILERDPDHLPTLRDGAKMHFNRALMERHRGLWEKAVAESNMAFDQFQHLLRIAPTESDALVRAAQAFVVLAGELAHTPAGDTETLVTRGAQLSRQLAQLVDRDPDIVEYQGILAEVDLTLSKLHLNHDNLNDAHASALSAVERARNVHQINLNFLENYVHAVAILVECDGALHGGTSREPTTMEIVDRARHDLDALRSRVNPRIPLGEIARLCDELDTLTLPSMETSPTPDDSRRI